MGSDTSGESTRAWVSDLELGALRFILDNTRPSGDATGDMMAFAVDRLRALVERIDEEIATSSRIDAEIEEDRQIK